ncbi:MAG: outer membrane beta-barrel protein [Caulobacteraceae bacterium]
MKPFTFQGCDPPLSGLRAYGRSTYGILAAVSLATMFVGAGAESARAQSASFYDRNNNTSVLDRPRPDYQPFGVQYDGFTISPSLTISPELDDNIYASDAGKEGDLVTSIAPRIEARSNWSRDQVSAFASLASDVYAEHSTESTTDYQIGGSGRLDILAQDNISANLSYGHNTESRTAENTVVSTAAPVQYDVLSGGLSSQQLFNRVRLSETFSFQRYTYQDTTTSTGAAESLAYQDSTIYSVNGRADYAINPELSLFLSETFTDNPYDADATQVAVNRSYTGTETTVGTDFDITRLIRGQIQVGYLYHSFTSTAFKPVSGPAFHGRIEYFLSGLTTLSAHVDRTVVDPFDPVASSDLQTQTGLRVDHELLRNVILSAQAGYEVDAFKGEDRTDNRSSLSLSATYLMNRHVGITTGYSFLNEGSSGADRITPYTVNVASLSFVFRL